MKFGSSMTHKKTNFDYSLVFKTGKQKDDQEDVRRPEDKESANM